MPWNRFPRQRGEFGRLGVVVTAVACLIALAAGPAGAAGIVATVTDEAGQPLPDAVVSVVATGTTRIAPSDLLAAATIDQRDETFVPAVVVIRPGGAVSFHNSDRTRHHVYSFSPTRPFELVVKPDDPAPAVTFDVAGSAAIGCNIHDNMAAYVYVTDAPRAAVTDKAGRAEISDLPAGTFIATVWHPWLRPKSVPQPQPVMLASSSTNLAVTLAVLPPRRHRSKPLY